MPPPPQELHAWQTPCPAAATAADVSPWQTRPDGSFQRAAEIVAAAATEAAAAAAAAVVAAAGTKIREQMEALQSSAPGQGHGQTLGSKAQQVTSQHRRY